MSSLIAALPNLFGPDMLIILLVIVVLFGSAKIPQMMRGLGSGINEFKKGLKEGEGEAKKEPALSESGVKPGADAGQKPPPAPESK